MHYNIPVFIPHLGCPFQCLYCNQHYISGTLKAPGIDDVHTIIRQKLSTIKNGTATVEVAFFGGSFTCLPASEQERYLNAVQPYMKDNVISGIRLSTRPDYINEQNLELLKKYGVTTIELGVQSMDDEVLIAIGRGHSSSDVENAAVLIKKSGFDLGLQTMIGLPGDNENTCIATATRVIDLNPDCVRIYPVLVLKDTGLETLFRTGLYAPLSLEEAVHRTAGVLKMYILSGINVIKVGLHPSDDYEANGNLVAGPFHPSFREMVMSYVWKNEFEKAGILKPVINDPDQDITIIVPKGQYNYAIGFKADNKNNLKKHFRRVRFKESDKLKRLEFNVDYR